ncbi:MAG: hypothetical protein ACYDH3_08550 [Candidatus Aminicenantales bacterium]
MGNDRAKSENRKFDVDLPALVQGIDDGDSQFVEQAVVSTINSEEAVLQLRAKVGPGMKVRLSLHIPRTFLLEKPLDLNLTGIVSDVPKPPAGKRTKADVRVRLDRGFRILPAPA